MAQEKEVKYKILSKGGLTVNFKKYKQGETVELKPSFLKVLQSKDSQLQVIEEKAKA